MKLQLVALLPVALLTVSCSNEEPSPAAQTPIVETPAAAASVTVAVTGINPVDIPPGFGYPGNREEFQSWADTWQIDNITTAVWNLWAGMTSATDQMWNGSNLPVWETWCGSEEVFSAAGCNVQSRPARAFKIASQLGHAARIAKVALPEDTQVVSFNKFNPAMANYLATPQTTNGAAYSYLQQSDLSRLNSAWPAGTPVAERKVVDAPYTPDSTGVVGSSAMETKPVIFVVKAIGLTPMPLWMGPESSTMPANATPSTWRNCVLLDPTNNAGPDTLPVAATTEQIAQMVPGSGMACTDYLYAPLSTIYNFTMDAAEASAWNVIVNNSGDGGQKLTAEVGDYGVLMGMHVNTKTIADWTWQTFWWQPGADAPANFPGSKQGMTADVVGEWRNYAMCSAWNQTKGDASNEMVVCFNPFLETASGIPAGQTSNCVSCHGVATAGTLTGTNLPAMNYPASYSTPINFEADSCTESTPPGSSTCLGSFTRTDFSWAVPSDAEPPAQ